MRDDSLLDLHGVGQIVNLTLGGFRMHPRFPRFRLGTYIAEYVKLHCWDLAAAQQ
jgi:hypothetical protein